MLRNRLLKKYFLTQINANQTQINADSSPRVSATIRVQSAKICVKMFFLVFFSFCLFVSCFAQENFVYNAKGKRNPFIPLVTPDGRILKLDKEESDTGLALEGIIYDKQGRSYAIVNGSIVGIGDIINTYQVLKIEKNKVVFIKEGELSEVELKKEGE